MVPLKMRCILVLICVLIGEAIGATNEDPSKPKSGSQELESVGKILSTRYPKYYKMIKSVYLDPMFNDRDITVFALSDETISNFTEAQKYTLERDLSTVYSVVLYQTVLGAALPSSFFQDGLFILTGLHNKAFLNTKQENGEEHYWLQGKKIIKRDIPAKRGMIHEIEDIVKPPEGSLSEYLRRNGKFENFLTALQRAQLLLPSGFTVFAPHDDAFWRIPENERVFYLGSRESNRELANMHIVPRTIFTSQIGDKPLRITTIHRRYITLKRAKNGITLSIDDKDSKNPTPIIKLRESDIAVNDGIVHVISDFIRPGLEPLSLAEKLQKMNFTQFYKGVVRAGFKPFLDYRSSIFTVFVPNDEALALVQQENKNVDFNNRMIRFHIVPGKILARNLRKFREIQTMSGDMLMLREFGGKYMAGKSVIVNPDLEVENGVMHIVDRVLTPRVDSVAYALAVRVKEKTSIFLRSMRSTGLHPLINDRRKFPNIFFVPSDEAFLRLPSQTLNYLLSDVTAMRKILRHHIVPGFFYSRLMVQKWVYLFKTRLRGTTLRIRSLTKNGRVKIIVYNPLGKTAQTIVTDHGAINGVVNIIDNLLIPPSLRLPGIASAKSGIDNNIARKRA